MKKLLLFLVILCGILTFGQNSSFIQLQTGPPAGVTTINVSANSLGGGMTYYYFVIATYPAGKVVSQGKQISNIAVPSVGSPVTITWGLDAAAISYDVIRLTSQNYNTSCTSCAVVVGTALGTVNDTGTLSNYLNASLFLPNYPMFVLSEADTFLPINAIYWKNVTFTGNTYKSAYRGVNLTDVYFDLVNNLFHGAINISGNNNWTNNTFISVDGKPHTVRVIPEGLVTDGGGNKCNWTWDVSFNPGPTYPITCTQ